MICYSFTGFDLVVLDVILLFQDVSGWKLRKMVKDLVQGQKGNPYKCCHQITPEIPAEERYCIMSSDFVSPRSFPNALKRVRYILCGRGSSPCRGSY